MSFAVCVKKERIHAENQIRVNELADAEYERERKFYLEKFSLYDDVLKNATLKFWYSNRKED